MLQNSPAKPHYSQQHLRSQVFRRNISLRPTGIPMIRHVLALRNTALHSVRSSSASTLKTQLNPLRHHPLFPSQTQLSPLSFATYSSASSDSKTYTVIPKPFTLAHRMSMKFIYPTKGLLEKSRMTKEKVDNVAVFCPIDILPEHYLPTAGDGADGGGIQLLETTWGDRALSLANEVLSEFGDDLKLFAFVTTPNGCILIRIESVSDKYGCPSVETLHSYFVKYRKRLVEQSLSGMLPYDLGVEVGCPGRRRALKVPDDLSRFKDLPMRVIFVGCDGKQYDCVLFLCSVEKSDEKEGYCVWCLSDFDPEKKDRPITRTEEWGVEVPFKAHKSVSCYVQFIPSEKNRAE